MNMKHLLSFFTVVVLLSAQNLQAQWVQTDGPYGGRVACFAMNGSSLFVGTRDSGVFLSTNNGASWTAVNNGLTNTRVFLSSSNGAYWTAVNNGLTNTRIVSFAVSGSMLFAGTSRGVFLSTNNGTSWTAINTGLTSIEVRSLAIKGANFFAGTSDGGVWRRPLSEIVTTVEEDFNQVPVGFALSQNHPNPFLSGATSQAVRNSSTQISFALPSAQKVTLKVYNLAGQEVATLLHDEPKAAGVHEVRFEAQALPGGMYFYRLEAKGFVKTMKMLLVR